MLGIAPPHPVGLGRDAACTAQELIAITGERDSALGRMCTATLINDREEY